MTKVTILGEEPQKKELKKIEFVNNIRRDMSVGCTCVDPKDWDNIVLLEKRSRYNG
jgi:hypothetical protein